MISGSAGSVFISYSRKDYYFAESLALHLERSGLSAWFDARDLAPGALWERDIETAIDAASTLVVVASPAGLESPNVRKEWERALGRGKRIVLAHRQHAKLPSALDTAESVDFRGTFSRAVEKLAATLRASAGEGARTREPIPAVRLRWPPAVIAMALALALPCLGCGVLSSWSASPQESQVLAFVVRALLPAFIGLLLWFFLLSFLRREMGMTRLAFCLTCLLVFFALPLLRHFFRGSAGLAGYSAGIIDAVTEHPGSMALMFMIPLAGLLTIFFLRPEDLLRWSPTGRAWGMYRATPGHGSRADRGNSPFERLGQYRLFYDPEDEPAAGRLRGMLAERGASAADAEVAESEITNVLLLTNRTRIGWFRQQPRRQEHPRVLTVIGSSIRLPPELEWLWRQQWVDLRDWDRQRLVHGRTSLEVPETVTGARFPAPVRKVHHLLCALAGVWMALPIHFHDPRPNVFETFAVAGIFTWCVVLAQRLLRRTLGESELARTWPLLWGAAVLLAAIDLGIDGAKTVSWAVVPAVTLFLIFFAVAMVTSQRELAFWFAASGAQRHRDQETLRTRRNWRTALWVVAYLLLWQFVRGARPVEQSAVSPRSSVVRQVGRR